MRIMRSHWVTVPNGETGNEANERWCVCFRAWSCDCSLLLTSLLRTGFYKVYFILIVALFVCLSSAAGGGLLRSSCRPQNSETSVVLRQRYCVTRLELNLAEPF